MNVTKADFIAFGVLCLFWENLGWNFSWGFLGGTMITWGIISIVVGLIIDNLRIVSKD